MVQSASWGSLRCRTCVNFSRTELIPKSLSVITRYTLRKASFTPQTYHLRISGGIHQILHQPFTLPSLVLFPLAVGLPPVYLYLGKPWYLTNVLGFAFSHGAIEVLKLDSFKTGAALLTGLFFYDIFWVFGTPVMVTVAKGLDAPIKVCRSSRCPEAHSLDPRAQRVHIDGFRTPRLRRYCDSRTDDRHVFAFRLCARKQTFRRASSSVVLKTLLHNDTPGVYRWSRNDRWRHAHVQSSSTGSAIPLPCMR